MSKMVPIPSTDTKWAIIDRVKIDCEQKIGWQFITWVRQFIVPKCHFFPCDKNLNEYTQKKLQEFSSY